MRSALESTLPWWIAGPLIGLVIVALLALANKRFGVVGGVTDLVHGSAEGRGVRSWRTLLVLGMVLGGAARTAGGCTSGHGLTGSALASPASIVSMMTIMASAVTTTFVLEAGVLDGDSAVG